MCNNDPHFPALRSSHELSQRPSHFSDRDDVGVATASNCEVKRIGSDYFTDTYTKRPTKRSIQRRVTIQFEFGLPSPPWMS